MAVRRADEIQQNSSPPVHEADAGSPMAATAFPSPTSIPFTVPPKRHCNTKRCLQCFSHHSSASVAAVSQGSRKLPLAVHHACHADELNGLERPHSLSSPRVPAWGLPPSAGGMSATPLLGRRSPSIHNSGSGLPTKLKLTPSTPRVG